MTLLTLLDYGSLPTLERKVSIIRSSESREIFACSIHAEFKVSNHDTTNSTQL
jgi:hypothetical protein